MSLTSCLSWGRGGARDARDQEVQQVTVHSVRDRALLCPSPACPLSPLACLHAGLGLLGLCVCSRALIRPVWWQPGWLPGSTLLPGHRHGGASAPSP